MELVTRALGGERSAHAALYQRHAAGLYASLVRVFRSHEEAEDALHDAFVVALDKLGQLRDPEQFRAWVMRSAVRVVFRRARRQRLLAAFFGPSAREEPVIPPGVEAHQQLREIFELLSTFPDGMRIAWTLRHVEGYSLPEAALACDCSLATVKRWISDADDRVRRRLHPEEVTR